MPKEKATEELKDQQEQSVEQETAEEQAPALKYTATIEQVGPCKKKVIIEVLEETIKNATDEQYENLRKEALLPGFRKGRAPRRLLEKRFGKETAQQIKLKLLADASELAIKDNELDVLDEPDIDFEKVELPAEGPLKFDFEVEVRPEIDLPPLEGIPISKKKLEITNEHIDREIEQLQKWSGIWTPRQEGAIELDDQIVADVIIQTEGVEEEDKLNNIEVYVRHNGFVAEVPVEKLDELLVGAKITEVKRTTVEVPKTYFREEYRGKKVDLQITIKEIKWLKPAELDENFLKRYEVQDEKELRQKIHDLLQSRLESQVRTDMTQQIYKYLLANTDFDLPLDIVAAHSATLLKRQYANLIMRGLPRDKVDQQMEQLRATSEERAKEQLKVFFIMDKIAKKLEVDVNEEEINGYIAQLAIQQGQRPERMREQMQRNGSLDQFELEVRDDKSIAKLLESAQVIEDEAEQGTKKIKKKTEKSPTKETKKTGKKE